MPEKLQYNLTAPQIWRVLCTATPDGWPPETLSKIEGLGMALPIPLQDYYLQGSPSVQWEMVHWFTLYKPQELYFSHRPEKMWGLTSKGENKDFFRPAAPNYLMTGSGKAPSWFVGILQSDLEKTDPPVYIAPESGSGAGPSDHWVKLTDSVSEFLSLMVMAQIAEGRRFYRAPVQSPSALLQSHGVDTARLFPPEQPRLYANFWDEEAGRLFFVTREGSRWAALEVRPAYSLPDGDSSWPMSYLISSLKKSVEISRISPPAPFNWESFIQKSGRRQLLSHGLSQPERPAVGEGEFAKEIILVRKNLHSLDFFEGLSQPERVQTLTLGENFITDLTPLERLVNLRFLSLNNNPVTSLRSLTGLQNLGTLGLGSTRVTSGELIHLRPLKRLQKLTISYTDVTDLSPLAHFRGWGLDLEGLVELESLETLSTMKKLTSLTVEAAVAETCDIPALLPQLTLRAEVNGVVHFVWPEKYFD